MNPLEFTSAITIIANTISCYLSADEIAMISAFFVQLGDTLATISAIKGENESKERLSK